ncbi:stress protein [Actinobacteria bacterium OK074]|nr:stress protein [Actinobacteria bacterium OK074]
MSTIGKGLGTVEVRLRWDPSPLGEPPRHLDIVGAVYSADAPYGPPVYVVHYESRSPDGTIAMSRHSETGRGLGFDEVMVLEFDRIPAAYTRVVVGVIIHQDGVPRTFADIANLGVAVVANYRELMADDLARVADATTATVAEFTSNGSEGWEFHGALHGLRIDPADFAAEMGAVRPAGPAA